MTTSQMIKPLSVGVIGVRGYVGRELVQLIEAHPVLTLAWVSSRKLSGQPLQSLTAIKSELIIESLTPEEIVRRDTQIVVLALPNRLAEAVVNTILSTTATPPLLLIDLSTDYRFNSDWKYSVAEIGKFERISETNNLPLKISNPGCYATAMQLAIEPVKSLLADSPHCFGVSGYSGTGTTPCQNNDPENLKDNILAYQLVDHLHEKEVSYHLAQSVIFTPHVAAFFRGIIMTIQLKFSAPSDKLKLLNTFKEFYSRDPLIIVQSEIPNLHQVVESHRTVIGGFEVSKQGNQGTIICCIDNLLKGAASQAIQNINLALGLEKDLSLDTRIKAPGIFPNPVFTNSIGT